MVNDKVINFLWSSDHHCVHNKTPTEHILGNMNKFFFKEHSLANYDLVLFGGDLFDKLVDASNKDLIKVLDWMDKFLLACQQNNVVVRFLEGTSSHDWEQQKHIRLGLVPNLNAKYINKLSIEVIPELNDLTIMYVPDVYYGTHTPDQIWEMALEELSKHNLTKVDIVSMHGGFRDQLPPPAWKNAHIRERWESICEYVILAGHIHIPGIYGKLHCSGSFDRIRHGEEHPKGAMVGMIDKVKNRCNVNFWENKGALPYKTIKLNPDAGIDSVVKHVYETLGKLKLATGHVRLSGGESGVINPLINTLTKEYPLISFTADNKKSSDLLIEEELYEEKTYDSVTLTDNNLWECLLPQVETELEIKGIGSDEALSVLKEFL